MSKQWRDLGNTTRTCNTRARVNALTSCTRSTSKSRNPCFALNKGALVSPDVLLSRSWFRDPEEDSAQTNTPSTVTSALRSEYASPSRCGSKSETFVAVVFGMRCASSVMKTPTQETPFASESCCRLYSSGETDATSRNKEDASRAFSNRPAATAAHSAIGPGACSCFF